MGRTFIEGLPCAGKSTLIKCLERDGEKVVHELGRVISPEEFPGNGKTRDEILAIDDWFIQKEHERLTQNTDGYFDRSYLTHLAYAYAYGRLTKTGAFEDTVAKYEKAMKVDTLPLPSKIIYIEESAEESIRRQTQRVALGRRALDGFWMNKKFLEDTIFAYEKIFESASDITIQTINSSEPIEQLHPQVANSRAEPSANPKIDLQNYISLTEN